MATHARSGPGRVNRESRGSATAPPEGGAAKTGRAARAGGLGDRVAERIQQLLAT
jgi:hypothetical protein